MRNLIEVLEKAKKRPLFTIPKIKGLIDLMMTQEKELTLDWDDGAGEDWIRLGNKYYGVAYIIHKIVPINFIRRSYFKDIQFDFCDGVLVDNYGVEEWCVDLERLKRSTPEMSWYYSPEEINFNEFSLEDLYFTSV